MRQIVRPEQLDLDSPGRRDYWVALEHDTVWGDHLLPLTVFAGREATEGCGVVATGANHGNEYEGPVAIRQLLREIDPASVRGRLILIPVLNPAAFRAATRESTLDDGVNLNRAFVDGAGDHPALRGITHRIASFFRQCIWPRVHVALDLHAGGNVAAIAPCTGYHLLPDAGQMASMEQTARWFGVPYVFASDYQATTPGLLPGEGERLGKIMIGSELGWGESVNPRGVRWGRQGIRAAAIRHGQMDGDVQPIDHHADGTQRIATLTADSTTIAPWSGHFEPVLPLMARVKTGDVVARLHDFERIDDPPLTIRARMDGFVFMHAWNARVRQGQHIHMVGKVMA